MTDPSSEDHLAASRLGNVVDDEAAKADCAQWAGEEIGRGRLMEDVVADLVANGWSPSDAEEICGGARRRTLHLRGGITRDEVARGYRVNDPNVQRQATPGHLNMIGALSSLLRAIFRFGATKDVGRRPAAGPAGALTAPAAVVGACCYAHPQTPARYQCFSCGNGVCATCDFAYPAGGHFCAECVSNPRHQAIPGGKKTVAWALVLAVWTTLIVLGVILLPMMGTELNRGDEAAFGLFVILFGMMPSVVGFALSLASRERGYKTPMLAWAALIWNGVIFGVWALLIINVLIR